MENHFNTYKLNQGNKEYVLTISIKGNDIRITCNAPLNENIESFSGDFSIEQLKRIDQLFESIKTPLEALDCFDEILKNQKVGVTEENEHLKLNFCITIHRVFQLEIRHGEEVPGKEKDFKFSNEIHKIQKTAESRGKTTFKKKNIKVEKKPSLEKKTDFNVSSNIIGSIQKEEHKYIDSRTFDKKSQKTKYEGIDGETANLKDNSDKIIKDLQNIPLYGTSRLEYDKTTDFAGEIKENLPYIAGISEETSKFENGGILDTKAKFGIIQTFKSQDKTPQLPYSDDLTPRLPTTTLDIATQLPIITSIQDFGIKLPTTSETPSITKDITSLPFQDRTTEITSTTKDLTSLLPISTSQDLTTDVISKLERNKEEVPPQVSIGEYKRTQIPKVTEELKIEAPTTTIDLTQKLPSKELEYQIPISTPDLSSQIPITTVDVTKKTKKVQPYYPVSKPIEVPSQIPITKDFTSHVPTISDNINIQAPRKKVDLRTKLSKTTKDLQYQIPKTTPDLSSQIPIVTVNLRPKLSKKPEIYYPIAKSTEIPSKDLTSQVIIEEDKKTHTKSPTEQLTIQVPRKKVDLKERLSKTTEDLQYQMPITTPDLSYQISRKTYDISKEPQIYYPIVRPTVISSKEITSQLPITEDFTAHVPSPIEHLKIQAPRKKVDLRQKLSKTTKDLQYQMPKTTPDLSSQIPITTIDLRPKLSQKPQIYYPTEKSIEIPSKDLTYQESPTGQLTIQVPRKKVDLKERLSKTIEDLQYQMPITTPDLSYQISRKTYDIRAKSIKPQINYPVVKPTELPTKDITSQVSIGEYRRTNIPSQTEQLKIQAPIKKVDLRQKYSKTTKDLHISSNVKAPKVTPHTFEKTSNIIQQYQKKQAPPITPILDSEKKTSLKPAITEQFQHQKQASTTQKIEPLSTAFSLPLPLVKDEKKTTLSQKIKKKVKDKQTQYDLKIKGPSKAKSSISDEKIKILERETNYLRNEHQLIHDQLNSLVGQFNQYNNQLSTVDSSKDDSEVNNLRAENKAIKAKLSELNSLRNEAAELGFLRNQLKELDPLRRKVAQMEVLKDQLGELNSLRAKVSELDSVKDQYKELQNLKAQVSQMNLIKKQLGELNALRAKVDELIGYKSKLGELSNLKALAEQINILKQQLEELDSLRVNDLDLDKLRRRLNELEIIKMKYEFEIEKLREEQQRPQRITKVEEQSRYIELQRASDFKMRNTGLESRQLTFEDKAEQICVKGEIIHNPEELELLSRSINKLNENQRITLNLLYKASIDSDTAAAFHEKCDDAQSTLVLVETDKGARFGGFTTCSWSGNCIDKMDEDAFVFSLDKMQIYENIPGEEAIGCYPKFGPIFLGCQIRIFDNAFTKGGTTYEKGLNFNTEEDYELTGGEREFNIRDIEVYEVISK